MSIEEQIYEVLTTGVRNEIKVKYIEVSETEFQLLKEDFGPLLKTDSGGNVIVYGPTCVCTVGRFGDAK